MTRCLIAAAALLAVAGCSAGADVGATEREVERFHRLAADGEYDRLYEEAAVDFRRSGDRRELRNLLEGIDEQLGDVESARRQGWHVNYTSDGQVVTLTYDTRFERGRATERFVYRVEDGRPLLLGYHINSDGPPRERSARRDDEPETDRRGDRGGEAASE